MDLRLNKNINETEEDKDLQSFFWSKFEEYCKINVYNDYTNKFGIMQGKYLAKIGNNFLKEKKRFNRINYLNDKNISQKLSNNFF